MVGSFHTLAPRCRPGAYTAALGIASDGGRIRAGGALIAGRRESTAKAEREQPDEQQAHPEHWHRKVSSDGKRDSAYFLKWLQRTVAVRRQTDPR